MKKEIWQEDQPVLASDLSLAQSSKEDAIKDRQQDTFVYGVLNNSQFFAEAIPLQVTVNTLPYSASIATGIAYDPVGERILLNSTFTYNATNATATTDNGISGTTLTPQSTGSLLVPLTAGQVNYVYISYLQTTDPTVFTLKEGTNERLFTKATDGYRVDVVTDPGPAVGNPDLFKPNANAVFLGAVDTSQVLTIAARHIYNLKQNNLQEVVPDPSSTLNALSLPYAIAQRVSHSDHIKAVGTGTVTPVNPHGLSINDITGILSGETIGLHETFFHESGISGNQTSVTSGFYGSVVDNAGAPIAPTFARDNFLIKKLITTEAVLVNGTVVFNSDFPQDFLFYFVDTAGNFLDNGFYTIYLDISSKSLKLAANGSPTNTGYRVKGVTSGTFTNLNVLPIATVTANLNNFLLWEVQWDSTGFGLGNDNFLTVTDKRFFGTIGSQSFRRDSLTDTVTIGHNLNITGNNNIVPAGVVLPFAGPKTSAPSFYLYCDGALYDKNIFPGLFAAVGYRWGGDGIQFFRVPDGRGGFLRGIQDIPPYTVTFNNITDILTTATNVYNHSGIAVRLTTTGSLPPELFINTTYWIIWLSATTFKLAASHANAITGTFINFTTNGTGTHTVSAWLDPDAASREAQAPGGVSGDNVGTYQADGVVDHTHSETASPYPVSQNTDIITIYGTVPGGSTGGITSIIPDGTGVNETRPLNIGICFIIKT